MHVDLNEYQQAINAGDIEVIANTGDVTQSMNAYVTAMKDRKVIREWSVIQPAQAEPINIPGFQNRGVQMIIVFTWVLLVEAKPKTS